jgi:putative FmdB family regulatory protein
MLNRHEGDGIRKQMPLRSFARVTDPFNSGHSSVIRHGPASVTRSTQSPLSISSRFIATGSGHRYTQDILPGCGLAASRDHVQAVNMPIFEFHCEACDRDFEELVSSSGSARAVQCPQCGERKAMRKISVFAAQAGGQPARSSAPAGGCGRCGDPSGPCGM